MRERDTTHPPCPARSLSIASLAAAALLSIACSRGSGPVDADDERCATCSGFGRHGCRHSVPTDCGPDAKCMQQTVACDARCCPASAGQEVGLDAAPWAAILSASTGPAPLLSVSDGKTIDIVDPTTGTRQAVLQVDGYIREFHWVGRGTDVVLRRDADAEHFVVLDLATGMPKGAFDHWQNDRVLSAGSEIFVARGHGVHRLVVADGSPRLEPVRDAEATPTSIDGSGRILAHRGHGRPIELLEPGRPAVRLGPESVVMYEPVWHPSGDFFLAWFCDDDPCAVVLSTPDGSTRARTTITGPKDPYGSSPSLAVSDDGGWIVHDQQHRRSELVVAPLAKPENAIRLEAHGVVRIVPSSQRAAIGALPAATKPLEL